MSSSVIYPVGGAGEAGGGPLTFVVACGRKSRSCLWGQAETWGELGRERIWPSSFPDRVKLVRCG